MPIIPALGDRGMRTAVIQRQAEARDGDTVSIKTKVINKIKVAEQQKIMHHAKICYI